MEIHGHAVFAHVELHLVSLMSPSAPFYTRTRRNIAFFLRTKLTHSISTQTFAVPNWLQNACKMLYQPILLPPVSDCCWVFFPFLSFTDTEWRRHFIFVLPCQKSQANKHTVILWGNFSFMIPSRSTARRKRESISSMYASITEECTHSPVCGSIGVLGCGLTAGILQESNIYPADIEGNAGLGQPWSMKYACSVQLHQFACSVFVLFCFC